MSSYPGYQGQQFIDLAQDGRANAKLLGLAVKEQGYDEQDIKKIRHYFARFGYLICTSLTKV